FPGPFKQPEGGEKQSRAFVRSVPDPSVRLVPSGLDNLSGFIVNLVHVVGKLKSKVVQRHSPLAGPDRAP
ncbi:hypothetical protein GWI33_003941, partial [Rhynchophorus ferrugineus]